jgi:hypothetical protein
VLPGWPQDDDSHVRPEGQDMQALEVRSVEACQARHVSEIKPRQGGSQQATVHHLSVPLKHNTQCDCLTEP